MADFRFLAEKIEQLRGQDRSRKLVPRVHDGVHLRSEDGTSLINFGANDYLGIAAQQKTPSRSCLTGAAASALVSGWTTEHEALAKAIAAWESTEAAVLFPSGYAACSGTIACLAREGDLILSDELNHASLIDGCRLSKATKVIYPHREVEAVDEILRKSRDRYDRVWIVTDGVFSMDGHVAPLASLCDLAKTHDATVIVDEAHGTGVLGSNGSGLCETLGLKEEVPIRIGTLSKGIGSQGGFVVGPQVVIDYLINHCRSLIFSTALAPAAVAAAASAIETIRAQPDRAQTVQRYAKQLRQRLSLDGDGIESCVPIVPLVVGSDSAAVGLSKELERRGFFVPAIRPPTVPEGAARVRVSLSAAHEPAMVQSLADAIIESGFLG